MPESSFRREARTVDLACVVVEGRMGSSWPMRDPVRDPVRDIRRAIRTMQQAYRQKIIW